MNSRKYNKWHFRLLEKFRGMLETKEQLRQSEIQFKEQCRQELAHLQKNLK